MRIHDYANLLNPPLGEGGSREVLSCIPFGLFGNFLACVSLREEHEAEIPRKFGESSLVR